MHDWLCRLATARDAIKAHFLDCFLVQQQRIAVLAINLACEKQPLSRLFFDNCHVFCGKGKKEEATRELIERRMERGM